MNFNTLDTLEKNPVGTEKKLSTGQEGIKNLAENFAKSFLGNEIKYLEKNIISEILLETENKFAEDEIENNLINDLNQKNVSYNKYKKSFEIKGENEVSMGEIVGARRWGVRVSLPKELEQFGDGKKIRKIMLEKKLDDFLCGKLNKELAESLAEKTEKLDSSKTKGYRAIADRSNVESKQGGVFAEQMVFGVAEGIAIDRPDLGLHVREPNAYADVNDKLDIIFEIASKKRGVGVNREDENTLEFKDKSIGIQLTTNVSPGNREKKEGQIAEAKKRRKDVDDIIYVEIPLNVLNEAIFKWQKAEKPVAGPWKFLSPQIRILTLEKVFGDFLEPEQIKSLTKNIK